MRERGAEELVMLGVRWCLIVQRLGLSDCDWPHGLPSERREKSEKLKSYNQASLRELSAQGSLRAVRDEAISH